MTLLEYITDLQSKGLSSEEIFAKAQEFKGRTKPEEVVEEVKTNVVADPVDAAAATKPENASEGIFSESIYGNGQSQYQEGSFSEEKPEDKYKPGDFDEVFKNVFGTSIEESNIKEKKYKQDQIDNILSNYKIGSDDRTKAYFQLGLKPDDTINKELFDKINSQVKDNEKITEGVNKEDMYGLKFPNINRAAIGKALGKDTTEEKSYINSIENIEKVSEFINKISSEDIEKPEKSYGDIIFGGLGINLPKGLEMAYEASKSYGINFIDTVAGEGASDFIVGSSSSGAISFIDPETNQEINYNKDPEKWLELSRLDRRTDTEIKTIYSDTKEEVGAAADRALLNSFKSFEKLKSEKVNLGEIVEEFDKDAPLDFKFASGKKLFGGIFSAFSSIAETAIPALLTRGASLGPQIVAPFFVDYNVQKANALYPDSLNPLQDLIKNKQVETIAPTVIGGLAMSLEGIGLKGISGQIIGKSFTLKPLVNLLLVQGAEGGTEWGQTGLEEVNVSLAKGDSLTKSIANGFDAMTSKEGINSFLMGVIAAGGIAAPSTFSQMMITEGDNRATAQEYINTIGSLKLQRLENKNPAFRKAIDIKIEEVDNSFKDFLNNATKLANVLNEEQQTEIIGYIDKKSKNNKTLKDLTMSYKRGELTSKQYGSAKGVLVNSNKTLTDKITRVQSKANLEIIEKETKKIAEIAGEENVVSLDKKQFTEEAKKRNIEDAENAGQADAMYFQSDGKIYINKERAAEVGALAAPRHELFHKVTDSLFNDPAKGEALVDRFLETLSSKERALVEKRITENYKFDAQGNPKPRSEYLKEYFTSYSDLVTNKQINFTDNLGENLLRFGKSLIPFWKSKGFINAEISSGRDVYNWIKDYNKSMKAGKGLDVKSAELIKQPVISSGDISMSKTASDAVQNIYDTKGKDGAFEIIQQYEGMANKIANKYQDVPGFDRQLLVDEILTGKRGVIDMINEYDPSTNVPVAAYINKYLRSRSIEAANRILKQEFETDVTEARGIVAEETKQPEVVSKKVKKPSETTIFDKATETRIDEAVIKNFKGDDVKFSDTRNVPKDVAVIYGEKLGINPQTITDKTRNYSKQDAEGLTKAKQLLLKNAKDDYARLPELKDDFGKGTFVPKNVKDALYTEGKLTGSLKDYMDLIREKPVKPIYRDRVGQTIRGLLNLAIRNRMLETAQPSQAKRLQSGALFSRTVQNFIDDRLFDLDTKGADALLKKYIGKGIYDINSQEGIDEYFDSLKNVILPLFPKGFISKTMLRPSNRIFSKNGKKSITVDGKETTIDEYYTNKRNELLSDTNQIYGKPFTGAAAGFKQRVYEKWLGNTPEALEKNNKNGRIKEFNDQNTSMHRQMWSRINKSIKENKDNARSIANLLKMVGNLKTHPHRLGAELVGWSPNPIGNKKRKYEWEHAMPATASYLYLLDSALSKNVDFKKAYNLVTDNYKLIALDTNDNYKLGVAKLGTKMPEGWNVLNNSWIERYFNEKVSKVDGGIDPNSLINLQGKSFADVYKIKTNGQPTTDLLIKKAKDAVTLNDDTFGSKVSFSKTTNGQVQNLSNYDNAADKARSLNTTERGISVFDFDDTLARTKSKVIVTMPDGKRSKIDAAEFAKNSITLEDQGAEFDFSEFNKVIDGKKGPLADLALRRQGKFGSKDIFVLTARPQIAATGIKTFLDGIGLNLPLSNITGLEDGSPQAKANWVVSKAAEGYNDFYFADDAIKNVKAVKEVLDQVDVKSKVQIAKFSKTKTFDKIFNDILESSTGIESYKDYSSARAQTIGASKGKFTFFNTPSAEDFTGLLYKTLGKGKVGDAQMAFYKTNLLDPYNRAELAVTKAKITAANDFKALKRNLKTLPKSLSKQTGIGGFTFSQAARVAAWTRQNMEIPGLSKRDIKELNDFVKNDAEMDVFVDELIKIQKGKPYPKPSNSWLGGTITSDILNEINKVNRKAYLQEWQENVDIIFSDKNMNKLEAAYGPNYVEALRDQLARMKSGSNRPIGGSRVVNNVLDWLNNSVGAVMFLNTRSAVLQTLSSVNFINFGNNNIYKAGKAFANQPQFWKDFKTLMNSPYLVERRNGLKINVSESEIADAVAEASNKPKAAISYLLNKGFIFTRIADSFAIAAGGSTFYRNQLDAYVKDGMDIKEAEKRAFDDFYAIAEENQQSSNPSKISQQQASGAGRVILAFANTPMQYARIIKRSSQDLINNRGDWKSNVSKIVYYAAIQNIAFNALQSALFADAFGEEEDDEKQDKTGRIANGMADSLLRGLGIQGAAVSALKNSLITIANENDKKSPKFVKAVYDLFDFSPPIDSKFRKLRSGANTITWERENIKNKGFSLNNPAYLAGAQIISGLTNIPMDRAIQKINNIRAITSNSSQNWQKVAMALGWSTWDVGLPYYGVDDKVEMTPEMILKEKVTIMKKETSTKQQKETLLKLGLTKQQIKALKYEEARVKKIIELQEKKDGKN